MVALVIASFLLAIANPLAANAHATPSIDDPVWSVTGTQEITVEGQPVAISPDGAWLAGPGPDENICLWRLPDLTPTCAGEALRVDLASVTWAPDSSAVAFSQDAARLLVDSDIMELATDGELTNLTDDPDELQRISLESDETGVTHADILPAWSADSAAITFVRGDFGGTRQSTELMRVDVASGVIEPLFTVSPVEWLAIYTPPFLLPDGATFVTIAHADPGNGQNGIWRISADGGRIDPIRLIPESDRYFGSVISKVSADGARAIVTVRGASLGNDRTIPSVAVLDITTGEITELDVPKDALLIDAAFVGDDDDILVSLRVDEAVDLVLNGEIVQGAVPASGLLEWSPGGRVLLPDGPDHAVVLKLEMEAGEPVPCGCTPPPEKH